MTTRGSPKFTKLNHSFLRRLLKNRKKKIEKTNRELKRRFPDDKTGYLHRMDTLDTEIQKFLNKINKCLQKVSFTMS